MVKFLFIFLKKKNCKERERFLTSWYCSGLLFGVEKLDSPLHNMALSASTLILLSVLLCHCLHFAHLFDSECAPEFLLGFISLSKGKSKRWSSISELEINHILHNVNKGGVYKSLRKVLSIMFQLPIKKNM